jgi:hypothetical protein
MLFVLLGRQQIFELFEIADGDDRDPPLLMGGLIDQFGVSFERGIDLNDLPADGSVDGETALTDSTVANSCICLTVVPTLGSST